MASATITGYKVDPELGVALGFGSVTQTVTFTGTAGITGDAFSGLDVVHIQVDADAHVLFTEADDGAAVATDPLLRAVENNCWRRIPTSKSVYVSLIAA